MTCYRYILWNSVIKACRSVINTVQCVNPIINSVGCESLDTHILQFHIDVGAVARCKRQCICCTPRQVCICGRCTRNCNINRSCRSLTAIANETEQYIGTIGGAWSIACERYKVAVIVILVNNLIVTSCGITRFCALRDSRVNRTCYLNDDIISTIPLECRLQIVSYPPLGAVGKHQCVCTVALRHR